MNMRPNTIWPLSLSIMKLPGINLLFIFANVGYKIKGGGGGGGGTSMLKYTSSLRQEERTAEESSLPAPHPT